MKELIRCPRCGESYYAQRYSVSTTLYWEPVWRDGVLQNANPNTTTVFCHCCACGHEFSYQYKGDEYEKYPLPL